MNTAHKGFLAGLKSAASTQEKILRGILIRNQLSQFGKEHGFSRITNIESFRRQVPLRRYDDFRPYIDRIVGGEKAVLCTDDIFRFISSSGSTGTAKVIPVTREYFTQTFNPGEHLMHGAASPGPTKVRDKAGLIELVSDLALQKSFSDKQVVDAAHYGALVDRPGD